MDQLLYKYLILHGQLGLPDIGTFYIRHLPATIDDSGSYLQAPTQQIEFSSETIQVDRNFFHFLANEKEMDVGCSIYRRHRDLGRKRPF